MTKEEAIKIIESNCSCSGSKLREACAMFIPELREREDERIRKEIIAFLTHYHTGQGISVAYDNAWIAYLEKQKEQKPEQETWPNLSNCIRDCKNCTGKCFYRKEEYQEHTPAEWSEEDEKIRKSLVEFFGKFKPQDMWNEMLSFGDVLSYLEKQKPAEWSEEDERNYEYLHQIICNYINNPQIEYKKREKASKELIPFWEKLKVLRPQPKQEWSEEDEKMRRMTLECLDHISCSSKVPVVNWLKSLPERFNFQSKQEWNEEDEKMLQSIIEDYEAFDKELILTPIYHHKANWLKSLRPSWKPSKEQISALKSTMYDYKDVAWYNNLSSLYDDLKKLV